CTCPVGLPMCKHAVALGLAVLANQPDAGARDGAVETRDASAPGSTGFATRGELEAWAAEHGVTHALWVSAEALYAGLAAEEAQRYGLRYVLARLALRDVGSRDGVRRWIGVRALEEPIAAAVSRELAEAAASVRAGRAEERSRPEQPDDAALAPLWSR